MRECLNCKKEYQHKREASKFCSGKCRVKYNRDHPQDKVTKVQMQVLYNMALSALEQLNSDSFKSTNLNIPGTVELPTDYLTATKIGVLGNNKQVEPLNLSRPQIALKSFQQHMNELADLETEYDYKKKAGEIEAADNLSRKQKDLLLTNMRQSKL